jgi:hypothetical protein
MRFDIIAWLLLGAIWLMTACTAMSPTPLSSSTNEIEQALPIVIDVGEPDAGLESKVAQMLGFKENSVTIRNVELVDWPDSCMGLPQTDELCAQVVVPGFKAVAETPQGTYILNGDREQSHFRLMPQPTETP